MDRADTYKGIAHMDVTVLREYVDERGSGVVLCERMAHGAPEYITWEYNPNKDCYSGNYYRSFEAASENFYRRVEGVA